MNPGDWHGTNAEIVALHLYFLIRGARKEPTPILNASVPSKILQLTPLGDYA
jgi:hypothetical protein